MSDSTQIIGLFADEEECVHGIESLRRAGYPSRGSSPRCQREDSGGAGAAQESDPGLRASRRHHRRAERLCTDYRDLADLAACGWRQAHHIDHPLHHYRLRADDSVWRVVGRRGIFLLWPISAFGVDPGYRPVSATIVSGWSSAALKTRPHGSKCCSRMRERRRSSVNRYSAKAWCLGAALCGLLLIAPSHAAAFPWSIDMFAASRCNRCRSRRG